MNPLTGGDAGDGARNPNERKNRKCAGGEMSNDRRKPEQESQPDKQVETMYEYGYRKSGYGPDELVTDAHGKPISVVDAMLSAQDAGKARTVTPHLCYFSPRIPGNTGSAIRLCAVTGTILHLVEPLGFNLQDTKLRRAGLDYHDMAHVVLHPDFDDLVRSMPRSRIIAFTAHATTLYTDIEYRPSDILLFGPEPGNIPDPMDIMQGPHVSEQVRLPMRPSLRSLNLTNCASIAIYEAWRQLGFSGGI
jgi:tRNA (cytidine/uridine-2'-O-)-methyltransferase